MTENCCSLDYCWNWLCAIKSFLELKPASHDKCQHRCQLLCCWLWSSTLVLRSFDWIVA